MSRGRSRRRKWSIEDKENRGGIKSLGDFTSTTLRRVRRRRPARQGTRLPDTYEEHELDEIQTENWQRDGGVNDENKNRENEDIDDMDDSIDSIDGMDDTVVHHGGVFGQS